MWLQEITRASFPFVLSFLNPNFVFSYMTWPCSFLGFGVPLHLASRICGVSALEAQAICSLSCFRSGQSFILVFGVFVLVFVLDMNWEIFVRKMRQSNKDGKLMVGLDYMKIVREYCNAQGWS